MANKKLNLSLLGDSKEIELVDGTDFYNTKDLDIDTGKRQSFDILNKKGAEKILRAFNLLPKIEVNNVYVSENKVIYTVLVSLYSNNNVFNNAGMSGAVATLTGDPYRDDLETRKQPKMATKSAKIDAVINLFNLSDQLSLDLDVIKSQTSPINKIISNSPIKEIKNEEKPKSLKVPNTAFKSFIKKEEKEKIEQLKELFDGKLEVVATKKEEKKEEPKYMDLKNFKKLIEDNIDEIYEKISIKGEEKFHQILGKYNSLHLLDIPNEGLKELIKHYDFRLK